MKPIKGGTMKFMYIAAVLLLGCGGENGDSGVRSVTSVECNDGTLIYVYAEDCSSVTCEWHGGVRDARCQ